MLLNPSRSLATATRMMAMGSSRNYETLAVKTVAPFVTHVEINRPDKLNAMNGAFWKEIGECFNALHEDSECRSIVISGAGRLFTSGLDFSDLGDTLISVIQGEDDLVRKFKKSA